MDWTSSSASATTPCASCSSSRTACPVASRRRKRLVSADPKSNLFNHQYTSLVTLAEACKEDLVVVDARTASRLGSLPRLLLVRSVNAVVRLVDPQTGRIAELHTG